jgi:HAMP domain-containing protein
MIVTAIVAVLLSFLVAHIAIGAMPRLIAAIKELGDGNLAAEVPKLSRKDEVGQLARAVEDFRNNLIEIEQLRTENQTASQRAEDERAAALIDMAQSVGQETDVMATQVVTHSTNLKKTSDRPVRNRNERPTKDQSCHERLRTCPAQCGNNRGVRRTIVGFHSTDRKQSSGILKDCPRSGCGC